jgi:hypothetical protein
MGHLPEALPNMNHKWKEKLTDDQKSILANTIGEFLTRLGYS